MSSNLTYSAKGLAQAGLFEVLGLRVVTFNPAEGWSRDASEDIAMELEARIAANDREISDALKDFIESHIGRRIGVQLALPLRVS